MSRPGPGQPETAGGVPVPGRDPLLETGPRLAMCALLQGAEWVDFASVRDMLAVSDSAISKHSRTLEDAGYLEVRKGSIGRRPRTWFRLTATGRQAFSGHLTWLNGLSQARLDVP
ncbi:winged helix-turn-helix domain-containing protein [Pseudonocardia sichuanensis]|uniref:Winged helix DNA-binding protein n=1 Tax=Pseudonocardia kunmingensis TaxID=630975 RepID=A0A543E2J2_9PSEU|nr:transcriptional regulator [Pseudonocardia kunmingensis]TQM15800.1 winged helix DNA-binding protein [Pseudonocardia kunmingensis]